MKKYVFSADLVKCLSIIAAIGIHLVIPITARPDFFGGAIWWVSFLFNCLFRISVPLFVILSGYLTLGKHVTVEENWRKVKLRLLTPLISYYLIFCLFYAWIAHQRAEAYDYAGIFHNLSKNTHSSLYFLVILVFIQLLNPLWNLLTEIKNKPILKYLIGFFLCLGAAAYLFYYLSLREGEVFSTFTYWLMWIGYYLFGYWVKTQPEHLTAKETKRYSVLGMLSYLFIVIFGYLNLWLFHNHVSNLFYIGGQTYADAYLSIPVMLMALSVFQLLMRSPAVHSLENIGLFKKPVMFIASISLGLYLNHLLILDFFSKLHGVTPDSSSMHGLIGYLATSTILTFGLTIPVAWFLKSVPGIRRVVGEKK